jgi:branched-chain amino acid transport system substrate-binding protein
MHESHQCYSNSHFGRMVWSDDIGGPILEDVTVADPREVSPPPGQTSREWLQSW